MFEPVSKRIIAWDDIGELGQLVAGGIHGRRHADEITVCKQNSDQGVGFMALARGALRRGRIEKKARKAPAEAGAPHSLSVQ